MGGKVVTVSSSVYNMAGDIKKRPNVIKSVIVGHVLQDNGSTMTDTFTGAYLTGGGIKLRNFYKWAEDSGYNAAIGGTSSALQIQDSVSAANLAAQIPTLPNQTVYIDNWVIQRNNPLPSATNYIKANLPLRIEEDWEAEYVAATGEIKVTFPNDDVVTYTPTDFILNTDYLFLYYTIEASNFNGSTVIGDVTELTSTVEFPSTVGWDVVSETTEPNTTVTLVQTITETLVYSDGRPDEVSSNTSNSSATYTKIDNRYKKETYLGGTATEVKTRTDYLFNQQLGEAVDTAPVVVIDPPVFIGGGVSYVRTTSTVDQTLDVIISTKTDEYTEVTLARASGNVFIYSHGSGNAVLDEAFTPGTDAGTFFPYIPLRIDNVAVDEAHNPPIYGWSKRAYRKVTGTNKINNILKDLEENPDIGDIDYAYLVFGVSLNSIENSAKEYLYRFFKMLLDNGGGNDQIVTELAAQTASEQTLVNYGDWWSAQSNTSSSLYGVVNRVIRTDTSLPRLNSITIGSGNNPVMNYNITVSWNGIVEQFGSGLAKANAKVGEVWVGTPPDTPSISGITFIWQITATAWKAITVSGLTHTNRIYDGKTVNISGAEALADIEESGFIIPMHVGVFRQMSLVSSTQLSTAAMYLVINTYQVRKKKWYESGWFKVFLVIVMIVIAVYTGGFSANGMGILGSNAAVGSALGLSGASAAIIGAAANAIAAAVLMSIIQKAAIKLFGEKWGLILGAIIGIGVSTFLMSGGSFSKMFSPQNLLKMTAAGGDAYKNYLIKKTGNVIRDSEKLMADYKKQMKEMNQKYMDEFGSDGRIILDPIALLERMDDRNTNFESTDQFINRTLLLGSDIVELSNNRVTEFTNISLTLQNS